MPIQAESYERDGNEQDEYLFYFRHALLVTDKLSMHPEIKSPQYSRAWKKINQDVVRNLDKLETLKPKIKKRHDTWVAFARKRKEDREQWEREKASKQVAGDSEKSGKRLSFDAHRRDSSPAFTEKRNLDPGADHGLAAKLARKELKKRKRHSGLRWHHGTSSEQYLSGRKDLEIERPGDESDDSVDDLAKRIIAAGRRGEDTFINRNGRKSPGGKTFIPETYHYPSVPQKSTEAQWPAHQPPSVIPSAEKESFPTVLPHRPPKIAAADYPQGPPVPQKIPDSGSASPTTRSSTATPELDARDFNFKPSAFTEAGEPLRTVFLPPALRSRFLAIAAPNTHRNLETCGILCGTLISNAFFISKLVIPEQEATSDTCDTVNEEALFDYCDSQDLLTLGWIHTHPTQTCFMSSRDLHTHSGYQVQMAESIAIVCAPQHEPSWGIFRLTDPPGLKTVLNCRQTGIFHPHAESNVYTDALKPGHVWELPGLEFEVVDLRPGKG